MLKVAKNISLCKKAASMKSLRSPALKDHNAELVQRANHRTKDDRVTYPNLPRFYCPVLHNI